MSFQVTSIVLMLSFLNPAATVRCDSSCYKREESVILEDGSYFSCDVKYDTKYEETDHTKSPAPAPEGLSIDWNGNEKKMNISWKQRKSDIISGVVEGYIIGFEFGEIYIKYKSRFKITSNKTQHTMSGRQSSFLHFNFVRCGTPFRPDDDIRIEVKGLPLPKAYDHDQIATKKFKIPGRETTKMKAGKRKKKIAKTQSKKPNAPEAVSSSRNNGRDKIGGHDSTTATSAWESLTTDTNKTALGSNTSESIIIITSVFTVMIMLAITVLVIKRQKSRKSNGTGHDKTTIIAIANTIDQKQTEEIHSSMEQLSRELGIQIRSSWSNTKAIVSAGLQQWFQNSIKNNNNVIVMFIDLSSGDDQNVPTEFQMLLQYHRRSNMKHKTIFLHKEQNALAPKMTGSLEKISCFLFKSKYHINDKLYRYLLRTVSQSCHSQTQYQELSV